MSSLNGSQVHSSEDQARRVATLRRGFQRMLNARPTTLQKALIKRAAMLTAKAEAAALDPTVSLDDLVRIDHCAARARDEMRLALHGKPDLGSTDQISAIFNGDGDA
jgi:hypothetical protein